MNEPKERTDTDRLNYLEKFLQSVDDGIIAFNDDPDIECDDTEDGMMPVGFRIASTGCHGTLANLGRTLREAIDSAIFYEENSK
jgi:hypothetical protein